MQPHSDSRLDDFRILCPSSTAIIGIILVCMWSPSQVKFNYVVLQLRAGGKTYTKAKSKSVDVSQNYVLLLVAPSSRKLQAIFLHFMQTQPEKPAIQAVSQSASQLARSFDPAGTN